jgi:hypothetical protein
MQASVSCMQMSLQTMTLKELKRKELQLKHLWYTWTLNSDLP